MFTKIKNNLSKIIIIIYRKINEFWKQNSDVSSIFATFIVSIIMVSLFTIEVFSDNEETIETAENIVETTSVVTTNITNVGTTTSKLTTMTTVKTTIKSTMTTTVTTVKTKKSTEKTSKITKEFLAYNKDSKRVHRSSCHYWDDTMIPIEGSVIEEEARKCVECNPDIEIINPYTEPEETIIEEDNYDYYEDDTYDNNYSSTGTTVSNNSLVSCPLSDDLNNYIYNTSQSYGVPYALVLAVIQSESNFQSDAYNSSGCVGLMQVNQYYNSDVNLWDPYQNVQRGIEILSRCYNKAGGDISWTYTYYHYGEYYNGGEISPYADRVISYYYSYCG